MKNYIQAALFASAFIFVQSNAVMNVSAEDMHTIMGALKGKTFEQPKEMVSEWLAFKGESLMLCAAAMTHFAEQFKDAKTKKAWDTAADNIKRLAGEVKSLPVPDQQLMKDFQDMDKWITHKAERMTLKAKQMRIIANQVSDKKAQELILKKAVMAEEMAKTMKSAS